MDEKKYFSLPAAARELGVSTDVLRQQYRTGLIPATKTPGGQARLTAETIDSIKQNGWPKTPRSRNEVETIQTHASEPKEVVTKGQPSYIEATPDNRDEPDFQGVQMDFARGRQEAEQRWTLPDIAQFHQRWMDHARTLLPYWLTPEQLTEVSSRIASEVRKRLPEDEIYMSALCADIVRTALVPLNRQRELTQIRQVALNRVLAKVPVDATDMEKAQFQALARSAIQQAGEQLDGEILFAAAWHATAPVSAVVELRRRREHLRLWASHKLPRHANENEQREARAAINRVIGQVDGSEDEVEVRDKLERTLEPILAGIAVRIEEERCAQRIAGLLASAKGHVFIYVNRLYCKGELDCEAVCDSEWRRELEEIVGAEVKGKLTGNETSMQVEDLVEKIVDRQLDEADDDEDYE